jgi:hypothetical protein
MAATYADVVRGTVPTPPPEIMPTPLPAVVRTPEFVDRVRIIRNALVGPDVRFRTLTPGSPATAASSMDYIMCSYALSELDWLLDLVGRRCLPLLIRDFAAQHPDTWSAAELRAFLLPDPTSTSIEAALCRSLNQHLPILLHGLLASASIDLA